MVILCLIIMGGYSYKSVRWWGRKDKVFLKEILGRIRNFGKKCLFLVIFCLFWEGFEENFSIFRAFLRKFCLLQGILDFFAPPVIRKDKISATRI